MTHKRELRFAIALNSRAHDFRRVEQMNLRLTLVEKKQTVPARPSGTSELYMRNKSN
jgi:hypothetical protein